jgi:hypothetical protein
MARGGGEIVVFLIKGESTLHPMYFLPKKSTSFVPIVPLFGMARSRSRNPSRSKRQDGRTVYSRGS